MSRTVSLHPSARLVPVEATAWYGEQRPGLGVRCMAEIE